MIYWVTGDSVISIPILCLAYNSRRHPMFVNSANHLAKVDGGLEVTITETINGTSLGFEYINDQIREMKTQSDESGSAIELGEVILNENSTFEVMTFGPERQKRRSHGRGKRKSVPGYCLAVQPATNPLSAE